MLGFVLLTGLGESVAAAEKVKYNSWSEIAAAMNVCLADAEKEYARNKNVAQAKKRVNDAYYGFYEKEGFERTVMAYLSGKRGAMVELQFSAVKTKMNEGAPPEVVSAELAKLMTWLTEDGRALDGDEEGTSGAETVVKELLALKDRAAAGASAAEIAAGLDRIVASLRENPDALSGGAAKSEGTRGGVGDRWVTFFASLFILLREGFEAILVIAAIVTYLIRSGNRDKVGLVYWSSLGAVVASVALAIGLRYVIDLSGANQEILEGVAMLLAVVVLFFVSHWMISKAEAQAWNRYLEGKVKTAVSGGSAFALCLAAFLAVFREGAETILFYQALMASPGAPMDMIWAGMAAATVLLAVLFVLIRYGSLKLPLKPFFVGTGILLFAMCVSFAGGGIRELQEADLIGVTPVAWIGTVDLLGIYPTRETLTAQVAVLAAAVAAVVWIRFGKRRVTSDAGVGAA